MSHRQSGSHDLEISDCFYSSHKKSYNPKTLASFVQTKTDDKNRSEGKLPACG